MRFSDLRAYLLSESDWQRYGDLRSTDVTIARGDSAAVCARNRINEG
jgi:hypothetical protein